jgi:hypothetical protein
MSIQEKENIVNIFSGLLITGIFSWYVYMKHTGGAYDLTQDFKQWGILFLIFMGVQIVARIVIYILFYILNTIITQREEKNVNDERNKLIKLKGIRNAYYTFSGIMLIAVILLAVGMPVYGIFIAWVIGSLLSELMENGSMLYFNRKGA